MRLCLSARVGTLRMPGWLRSVDVPFGFAVILYPFFIKNTLESGKMRVVYSEVRRVGWVGVGCW